jgi:chromosome segregation ATPase
MGEADRVKMREQMLERMLDEAGLTSKEKSAARAAIKAKDKARQTLADELTSLRRTANKSKPTDQELKEAMAAYRSAMARYRKEIASQDAALVKRLSLRGQARCLSLGVLDNGLSRFGPGGPGGPRPPR